MEVVKQAASRFHCVAILKGARTLIADPSGSVFINPTGNVGMATGGTGDSLAGIIGGLLAQGLGVFDAAICGTFIHGLAGDIAADALGTAGMLAGDLIDSLPCAMKRLYQTGK
jgi:NAD(P)H-hydrate epimerase